jgi:hypothetical protein
MPKRETVSTAELNELLKQHEGDRSKVAEVLGMDLKYVSRRIIKTPALRAIWSNAPTLEPDSPEVEERKVPRKKDHDLIADKRSIDTWQKNGRDIFMSEVSSMLHDKDNIQKLDIFKGFEGNVGLHMARCLEMTQNVNIRQNVTLFEVAEKLKTQIMDGGLDEESEILKTRLFISCCEQQGKFYDRLLRGLEAMLKLTEKEKSSTKKKVGFRPLSELQKIEEAQDAEGDS